MPEETNKEVVQPIEIFQTERNSVSWPIVQVAKTRGKNEDKPFLKPLELTKDNLSNGVAWLGEDMVISILNAKLALMGSNITDQATSDDGVLDPDLAKKYFAEFSTRGETKAELEEKQSALMKEMTAASVNPALSMEAKIEAISRLGTEINSLSVAIENKARERKPKTAAAMATPVEA